MAKSNEAHLRSMVIGNAPSVATWMLIPAFLWGLLQSPLCSLASSHPWRAVVKDWRQPPNVRAPVPSDVDLVTCRSKHTYLFFLS